MRKMVLLGLVLVLLGGCKKKKKEEPPPPAAGSGSGQFGTVQAVRMAAVRTVNLADLDQIRLFIETASTSSGRMPTVQEINAALRKEAPKIYKQVEEGAIVLTGATSREQIWGYTRDPVSPAGQHLIVTSSSIERIFKPDLDARLKKEGK